MGVWVATTIVFLALWWAFAHKSRRVAKVEPDDYVPEPRRLRGGQDYGRLTAPSFEARSSVPLLPYNRATLEGMSKRPSSPLTLDIAYRDAQDSPTWRRIEVTGVSEFGEYRYLEAWCHLRSSPRSFRIDRIAEIVTPATGETFSDASAFLARFAREQLAPGRDQASVMIRARTGLVPLIWIARSDYELSDAELDLLVEYVGERNLLSGARFEGADWNRALARRWIETRAPTLENARGALSAMTKDGRERNLVARFAARLAICNDADNGIARRIKTLGLDRP